MIDQLNATAWWWVGTAIGGGLVLMLAAWSMRGSAPAATRQRLGEFGILAAVLLALSRLGPTWLPISLPAQSVAAAALSTHPKEYFLVPAEQWEADAEPDVPPSLVQQPAPTEWLFPLGWLDGLVIGYLVLVIYFLVRWFIGQWGLHRLVRKSSSAPAEIQSLFASLVPPRRDCRLCVSDRVRVPMCCGLLRPTVIVPRLLIQTAGTTTLRWVFTHEITHLERRDPWSCWLLGLAQAIYFYLPWFWYLRRQVRLCQEFVADAAAVAQGSWADDYAQFLVSLARCPAAPRGATGVLGNRSDLYRRVDMVLNPAETRRRTWSRGRALTIAFSLTAIAAIGSGVGLRSARAAEPPTPTEANAEVFVIVSADDQEDLINDLTVKRKKLIEKLGADHAEVKALEQKIEAVRKSVNLAKASDADVAVEAVVVADEDTPDVVKHMNHAEMEKKVRAALEKAKLSDEQVKQVLEELKKVHKEQFKVIARAVPGMAGGFGANAPMRAIELAHVRRGGGSRLGIDVDPVGPVLADQLGLPQGQGLVIQRVRPGSSAEKAGIKPHDILLTFNGQNVTNDLRDLVKAMEGISADKEFDAVVLRKGKKESVTGIKLAKADDGEAWAATDHKHAMELAAKEWQNQFKADGMRFATAENFLARRPAPGGKSLTVTISNGEFKAAEQDGDLTTTVIGKVDGKKVDVTNVTIYEPGVRLSFDKLENVPEKYRDRVSKLISNAGDSPVRFEGSTR